MGKSSGPKSVSTLTKSQQTLSNQLINLLSPGTIPGAMNQAGGNSLIGQGATKYPGQIVPNLIPQYQQVLQMLQNYNPQGMNQQAGSALSNVLSGRPASQVPTTLPSSYLQQGIINPMMHQFNTQVAPQIREGFGHVGAFSSAEGSSLGNALSSMNVGAQQQFAQAQLSQQQLAEQLNTGSWESAANRQMQGIGLANQQSLLPLQQASAFSSVLNPFQQNAQAQGQAQYSDFLRTAPENSPWTQLASSLISQQQKALYNPPNPFSQAIGSLGGILGLASGGLGLLGSLGGAGAGIGVSAGLSGSGMGFTPGFGFFQ